jgi:hypothetical protein
MHCSVAPGTAEDGKPFTQIITDYFDFAGDSASVNRALNAQARSVPEGDYRYARIEFCKYGAGSEPNIRWAAEGVPLRGFTANQCGVTSAKMEPALHLVAGQSVAVTLSYDLSTSVVVDDNAHGLDCVDTAEGHACFTIPTFAPFATLLGSGGASVVPSGDAGTP